MKIKQTKKNSYKTLLTMFGYYIDKTILAITRNLYTLI